MRTTLAILAVTLMKTGVCIAGVRRDTPAVWVRPVRDFGSLLLGDITYLPAPLSAPATSAPASGERRIMRPFDLVEFALGRARHEPPHIEDWTCDFAHSRPRLLSVLPEADRPALLDASAADPDAIWTHASRSLGTLYIEDLTATFFHDAYTGKYEARLAFPGMPADLHSVACTDLKWRALGKRLLADPALHSRECGGCALTLRRAELDAALGGMRRYWLALGTSRAYDGRHWPLIVGTHTLPDYEADIEYSAL